MDRKPVSVTCFGSFEVRFPSAGTVMKWRTRKGKEFFAFLVHMQGRYVDRATLINKLWLESELDYNISDLHNIIYNIRKNMEPYGLRELLQCERGPGGASRYRLKYEAVEAEADEVRKMAAAVKDKNIGELLHFQELLCSYKGTYMGSVSGEWHIEWAEYFEKIYINGCYLLAGHYAGLQEYEEAVKYLKVGLGIDTYAEQLAGMLIRCYGKMGDYKNMKKNYERYTQIMLKDLGIRRSAVLEAAYRQQTGE